MILDFPRNMKIRLASLFLFFLRPDVANLNLKLFRFHSAHPKVHTISKTDYFFNLLLEVPIRSNTLKQLKFRCEQIIGM